MLLSAAHQEVQRRGDRYARELGDEFAGVVLRATDGITHPDPETAVRSCFATPSPVDDGAFVAHLGETAVRYLLGELPR